MLVLSRRENDRIVFPTLGVSIEVMKLTRSRASIGIDAPQGIRVIRHELLDEEMMDELERSATFSAKTQCQHEPLASQIRDEIESTSTRLQAAQEEIASGNTEDALATLAAALADLDALRSELADQETPIESQSTPPADLSQWEVAGGVAESNQGYLVSENTPRQDVANEQPSVVWVDLAAEAAPAANLIRADLDDAGLRVADVSDDLTVLYELSRQHKPDAVLLNSVSPTRSAESTVRLIRNCSQHRDVPIFLVSDEQTATPECPDQFSGVVHDACSISRYLKPSIESQEKSLP